MIHIVVPFLPPSVNKAYFQKGPRRILTTAGKKFKLETKTHIARTYPAELMQIRKDVPMGLVVELVFPNESDIYNRTWPNTAKTRYKRMDVSNRIKLFEDALSDATGVDDSQHLFVGARKSYEEGVSCTHAWLWNMEEEDPLNDIFTKLRGM